MKEELEPIHTMVLVTFQADHSQSMILDAFQWKCSHYHPRSTAQSPLFPLKYLHVIDYFHHEVPGTQPALRKVRQGGQIWAFCSNLTSYNPILHLYDQHCQPCSKQY